jgi:hypothetical protein
MITVVVQGKNASNLPPVLARGYIQLDGTNFFTH